MLSIVLMTYLSHDMPRTQSSFEVEVAPSIFYLWGPLKVEPCPERAGVQGMALVESEAPLLMGAPPVARAFSPLKYTCV